MNTKFVQTYVRKYEPPELEPFVINELGKFFIDYFIDPDTKIYYHVMLEPSWIHFEPDTTYEIEVINGIDGEDDTYKYRLARRLTDNIIIIAEYYDDKFYINTIGLDISETLCRISKKIKLEDYKLPKNIKISKREEITEDTYFIKKDQIENTYKKGYNRNDGCKERLDKDE